VKVAYSIIKETLDDCWIHHFILVHLPYFRTNNIFGIPSDYASAIPFIPKADELTGLSKHFLFFGEVP